MAAPTIEVEIHNVMARLTAAEKRAARALIANYPTLGLGPVADFAREAGASPATVLRFVTQLGYGSYPDFQRRLREELEERIKSPLQKSPPPPRGKSAGNFLSAFAAQVDENLRESAARIPASEFEAICEKIADARIPCHLLGGRFTDALALYLAAHLRIVRSGVRTFEARAANRIDQLLDVKGGDVAIVFDIRRYDSDLLETAQFLSQRRATIVLVTDSWISPISRHAKYVLPCQTDIGRTWDSSTALFALCEAIIARVTQLTWDKASARMKAIERLHGEDD